MKIAAITILTVLSLLIAYILGRMAGYDKATEEERNLNDEDYFKRFKVENDYLRLEKEIQAGAVYHRNTQRAKRNTNAYKRAKSKVSSEPQASTPSGVKAVICRIKRIYSKFKD